MMPVRCARCGSDDVAVAAIFDDELLVAHDDVVEAHATLADDATLFVEYDRGPEVDGLGLAGLGIHDVRRSAPVCHRIILEVAFAALVADRTIQRMIDEQQLDDRRPARVGFLAARAHDHSVGDLRVARNLQLGHTLDLDEADATQPCRAQLAMVAVDRNLLIDDARRFDEQRALRHGELDAVDRELHEVSHGYSPASLASKASGKRTSTDFKNGSIESPSGQRLMPVIAALTRCNISRSPRNPRP